MLTRTIFSIVLVSIVAVPGAVFAEKQIGLRSVYVNAGIVSNVVSGFTLGARADLGEIADNLSIDGSATYTRWGPTSALALLPGVTYRVPRENSRFTPFAEGGLGLHMYRTGALSSTLTGIYLGGGIDYATVRGPSVGGYLRNHFVGGGFLDLGVRVTFPMGG